MFIFKLFFFVRVFVQLPLLWLYVKFTNSGHEKIINLKKSLFWGEILIMCIEGYIELLIAGYINATFHLNSTNGEVTAKYVAFYCLITSLVVMPLIMAFIIYQKPDQIR